MGAIFASLRSAAAILSVLLLTAAARAQTGSPFVGGAWCGNVTTSSATVCVRLAASGLATRLVVSPNQDLSAPLYSESRISAGGTGNTVALDIAGLPANTLFYYGVEVGGALRTEAVSRGRFRTFPQGAASFKLALLGDGDFRDSDQRVYEVVAAEDPLLLLYNGDLHYLDLNTTDPEDYRRGYDSVLSHPSQGRLFRSAPLAYVWDDHDFAGGDNTNGSARGGAAARTAYGDSVPHYPLRTGDGTIAQAFTVGRVRIIMTDLRSASAPQSEAESAAKSRMGATQKAWFKQELLNAREAGFPLIIWVSTDPWIEPAAVGADSWAGYATERAELADFIKANRIRNLVIFSGDMHAIAYDDGTHSDYATGGGAPLIVLHSTPLTRDPNSKGGPFTAGPFLSSQQYGILEVTDNGGSAIQCRFSGKRVGEGAKLIQQFSASASAIDSRVNPTATSVADRVFINLSARSRINTPTEMMIAGFVVAGRTPRTVLLRAVGPSLTAWGIAEALPQPRLLLFQGADIVASNDNWGLLNAGQLAATFERVGAFALSSPASRDAALLLTLEPGAYTAQVGSGNGALGVVLLEVYEVP